MNDVETLLINKKYRIHRKIGKGKFGSVYLGENVKTGEKLAMKVEPNSSQLLLKHEAKLLNYLNERGGINIPLVYWFGPYNHAILLVMPYYDYSLQDEIERGRTFPMVERNKIAIQLLRTLEYIHSKYVIHRDIKPQNIMMKSGKVYLIDFGIATFYINELGTHIKNTKNETMVGSLKYVSWNIHNGDTPSRRDDLISLGYIYILLLMGELPWSGSGSVSSTSIMKSYENMEVLSVSLNEEPIKNYIDYCYQLTYDETPNYEGMIDMFSIDEPTPLF